MRTFTITLPLRRDLASIWRDQIVLQGPAFGGSSTGWTWRSADLAVVPPPMWACDSELCHEDTVTARDGGAVSSHNAPRSVVSQVIEAAQAKPVHWEFLLPLASQ